MPRIGTRISESISYAVIFAVLLLSGCASLQAPDPEFYPVDPPEVVIVDTTPIEPLTITPQVRAAVAEIEPDTPVYLVSTLDREISEQTRAAAKKG